jgi:hypothetical protein
MLTGAIHAHHTNKAFRQTDEVEASSLRRSAMFVVHETCNILHSFGVPCLVDPAGLN